MSLNYITKASYEIITAAMFSAHGRRRLVLRSACVHVCAQVINFTMPATMQQYVHRVGRTARAGRAGRSVSMAGETERTMIREISRRSLRPVEIRTVPQGQSYRTARSDTPHYIHGQLYRTAHSVIPNCSAIVSDTKRYGQSYRIAL